MWYASVMSQTAAWEPGGKLRISVEIVWKVPQVHGNSSELREELMDGVGVLLWGKERFWISRYLPGFPDLGTRDRGDD